MNYLKDFTDEELTKIKEGIDKFLEIKEKWGEEVIFKLFSKNFELDYDPDTLIRDILINFEVLFGKLFTKFLLNIIGNFNIVTEEVINQLDPKKNNKFFGIARVLSAVFGRKIRKLRPDMIELCWTRITSGFTISEKNEIKFIDRLTKYSGDVIYFELDLQSVFNLIKHMFTNIIESVKKVEETNLLYIPGQELDNIETILIDIYQYKDTFSKRKNEVMLEKEEYNEDALLSKIDSSYFFSPRGAVRFRYSLKVKEVIIEFDSEYRAIIMLIRHFINQLLRLLNQFKNAEIHFLLEEFKEILRLYYDCQKKWKKINDDDLKERREEIEKRVKDEEENILNTLMIVEELNGEFEAAVKIGKDILEKEKDSFDVLYNLGRIYSKMGNQEEAITLTNKALSSEEIKGNILKESRSYYNLACFYALNEDIKKSEEYLQKAVKINPIFYLSAQDDEDFDKIRDLISDQFRL